MLSRSVKIRVRYNETDQMGIVNNARYPTYFEIGRTELFRYIGVSYAQLEKEGLLLPVSELYVKYYHPAYYDDELTINATINEMPTSRMRFDYEIYNNKEQLITTGYSVLAFLYGNPAKPARIPQKIKMILEPFFTK